MNNPIILTETSLNALDAGSFSLPSFIGWVIGGLLLFFIFQKANEPGWAGFVPIYNTIVLLRITGYAWYTFFLFLIPVVNVIFGIIVLHKLSTAFGRSALFTVGLIFLAPIFLAWLAFGADRYRKPA